MYYLLISVAAAAVCAIVLFLEHLGDPADLERDYAMGPKSTDAGGEKQVVLERSRR